MRLGSLFYMQQPFRKGKKRMKISSKPCYSLKEMKRLVENGDYSPTLRVADFIDRHYGKIGSTR